MKRIAKFEKISIEQWKTDSYDEGIAKAYDNIQLPVRKTYGSAGYDFLAPIAFKIDSGQSMVIPTGIRCQMDSDYVLCIFPRSGLGFEYGVHLSNTVGIIDCDYYFAENEGHIMIKLVNPSYKPLKVQAGQGFAQGIFLPFGVTYDDNAQGQRRGGFGSTDNVGKKTNGKSSKVLNFEMRIIEPPAEKIPNEIGREK